MSESLCEINLEQHAEPLHILIADEDPAIRQLAQGLLSASYSVTLCAHAKQAVHQYMRILPELIFIDAGLSDPEFSGVDAANAIMAQHPDANIVMMATPDSHFDAAKAARAGALGLMVKPFNASTMLSYVQECEHVRNRNESLQ